MRFSSSIRQSQNTSKACLPASGSGAGSSASPAGAGGSSGCGAPPSAMRAKSARAKSSSLKPSNRPSGSASPAARAQRRTKSGTLTFFSAACRLIARSSGVSPLRAMPSGAASVPSHSAFIYLR